MLQPKAPKKPTKPNKPPETVDDSIIVKLDDFAHDNKSIGAILEEFFPGISLTDIKVEEGRFDNSWSDRGYDYYLTVLKYYRQSPNPKYDEQMTKYHIKLEQYKEASHQYKLDVEKYKEDLALWHKEQLEKLDAD